MTDRKNADDLFDDVRPIKNRFMEKFHTHMKETTSVNKDSLAAKVDNLEIQRDGFRNLAGEMLATMMIEQNQEFIPDVLKTHVQRWKESYECLKSADAELR